MASCTTCGHELERHLFGGMCFHCDCKRATFDLSSPVYLEQHGAKRKPSRNGTGKKSKEEAPRLGNT